MWDLSKQPLVAVFVATPVQHPAADAFIEMFHQLPRLPSRFVGVIQKIAALLNQGEKGRLHSVFGISGFTGTKEASECVEGFIPGDEDRLYPILTALIPRGMLRRLRWILFVERLFSSGVQCHPSTTKPIQVKVPRITTRTPIQPTCRRRRVPKAASAKPVDKRMAPMPSGRRTRSRQSRAAPVVNDQVRQGGHYATQEHEQHSQKCEGTDPASNT